MSASTIANKKNGKNAEEGSASGQPDVEAAINNPRVRYQPQVEQDQELAALHALAQAAKQGDRSALDQLRAALDDLPHVWQQLADLGRIVEGLLVDLVAGDDLLAREMFFKRCSAIRSEMSRPGESLLSQMCSSRVVISWLFCQAADLLLLKRPDDPDAGKRVEQMERRYQAAVKTYALLRQHEAQLRPHETS